MKYPLYYKLIGMFLFVSISLSSCVSTKKYDALLTDKINTENERADLEEQLEMAKEEIANLNNRIERLNGEISKLVSDTTQMNKKYGELERYYNNLLVNSDKLSKEFVDQQKKIHELEKVLEEKEKAVNDLRHKVSQALLNFKENDLTVNIKNGKVYVSLAEQLLFGSGSIVVDKKGIEALKQLSGVLRDNPDINIMVEGHTDNVPISRKSQYMQNNWDLSVLRATSIVDILTESGVDPTKITAAGKGEHAPLNPNETAEGKQKNRRTEIILTPELDELFQILETN